MILRAFHVIVVHVDETLTFTDNGILHLMLLEAFNQMLFSPMQDTLQSRLRLCCKSSCSSLELYILPDEI